MKRLLDTNAYVALKRGHREVARLVRSADSLVFSTIVLGELLFGFRNGTKYETIEAELDALLQHPAVSLQLVSRVTADRFGRIAALLKRAGTPIPTNDIWIAAHVLETGAELVTLDQHFARIPGLVVSILQPLSHKD